MHHEILSLVAVGVLASVTTLGVQEVTQTFFVNLKDPHPIEGDVNVSSPIPHSDMASMVDVVVAPATREQTGLWTDVGPIDTAGFTSVVLSLHGQLRGSTGGTGVVSLVLCPTRRTFCVLLPKAKCTSSSKRPRTPCRRTPFTSVARAATSR